MGKILFAALLAGVFGGLVVYFLLSASHGAETAALTRRIDEAEAQVKDFDRQLTAAKKQVLESDRRGVGIARDAAAAKAAADEAKTAAETAVAAVTGNTGPADGSKLITEKQAQELIDKALAGRHADPANLAEAMAAEAGKAKTVEEISAEMGLSSSEEARLRDTIRGMEEDMVRSIFGDRPIADIERDVREAKDDPDKQEALIGQVVGNGLANIAKIATAESRLKKRVNEILGEERGKAFLAKPRKPVIDVDMDKLFD
jgi:hypothetical protein